MDDFSLDANTGANDANSVWGSGLLGTLGGLATTGANVYRTVTGGNNRPAPATITVAAPAAAPAWQKYLPWALGGLAAVVVLSLVLKR